MRFLFPLGRFLGVLGRVALINARDMASNPRSMKKLFSVRHYVRLYRK